MAEDADKLVAGRYRFLSRLGQGGMGVVWRAHDELLRRDVAVKELHVRVGIADDDLPAQRMLREARAAARLRHPGVVAVHDVIVDSGRPLIVMELVEGRSLAEAIRADGPLPEHRVAAIGAQVLEALALAHRHGIVHRDVKPANILLDGDRAVLTDFGIAAMAGDTSITDSRAVLGSPEYLAPERVNGEPATPATDLWSLGVTLCAALRGESPFQRADTQATLAAVLTYEPPPIPRAPQLWPLLAGLLNKNPAHRPTAEATLDALAGRPTAPATPEPVAEPAKPRAKARLVPVLGVVALVVVVAAWLVVRPGGEVAGTPGTVASTAPAGFTQHWGSGYTIAVPTGWYEEVSVDERYWASSRDDQNTLIAHVTWWDEDEPDARSVLTDYEQDELFTSSVADYVRIRFDETPAPNGMTAAELESTFRISVDGDEFYSHELLRAVVTGEDRTYVLTVAVESGDAASRDRLWQDNSAELATILENFRITPDALR
jgi:hypothetical protein